MSGHSWVPDSCEIILLDYPEHKSTYNSNSFHFLVISSKIFNDKTSCVIGFIAVNRMYYFVKLDNFNFKKFVVDKNKNINLDYFELNRTPKIFNISIEIQALWAWSEFNGYAS
jgi:hypothetical protein